MTKEERYIRNEIARASHANVYEISVEKTLVPDEVAAKLRSENYRLRIWRDFVVIEWSISY